MGARGVLGRGLFSSTFTCKTAQLQISSKVVEMASPSQGHLISSTSLTTSKEWGGGGGGGAGVPSLTGDVRVI